MTDRRLGLGWKADRRRCWCEEGLIKADKDLFTRSAPSTPPILTNEFVIADLRIFNDPFWNWLRFATFTEYLEFLWKEHLKEPGCFVGEHMHVFFLFDDTAFAFLSRFFWTEIERLGDADLWSIWNLTDDTADDDDGVDEEEEEEDFLYIATGFIDDGRDMKAVLEEAKADGEEM